MDRTNARGHRGWRNDPALEPVLLKGREMREVKARREIEAEEDDAAA
jgi:hypothetical protein